MSVAAWEAAATFLYTSEVTLDQSSLLPMLEAAAMLQITSLIDALVGTIAKKIRPQDVAQVWEAADRLTLPRLAKAALYEAGRCTSSIQRFARSAEFGAMPEELVKHILTDRDGHSWHTASKTIRTKELLLRMTRDGSSRESKMSKVTKLLKALGGTSGATLTIDKEARVHVVYVADPVACDGGDIFDIDFCNLHLRLKKGHTFHYTPGLRTYTDWRRNTLVDEEAWRPKEIAVAEGYPKTVRIFTGETPLAHYKVQIVTTRGHKHTMHIVALKDPSKTNDESESETSGDDDDDKSGLLKLWSVLQPKAVVRFEHERELTEEQFESAADFEASGGVSESGGTATLAFAVTGLWIDEANVPAF